MEKTMHRFTAAVALLSLGCSSDEPGASNGQATTIVDADAFVLGLSHEGVGLSVFKYNEWLISSSTDCKSLKGKMSDVEMSELKSHMADEAIKGLGKECEGDNYRITIGLNRSVCSPVSNESPGISGLIAFYEDKATKLASKPAGKCGEPQTVTPSSWPKDKAAAGSGS
jgi:hypothetical protein